MRESTSHTDLTPSTIGKYRLSKVLKQVTTSPTGCTIMPLNEQRAVANVRERKRTQKLNQAYKQLQTIIPKEPSDKMSKIHTLKLALSYIDFLSDILKQSDSNSDSAVHSTTDSNSIHHRVSPCTSSPCPSSASNYVHLSNSATSEDDDEFFHRSKRARFDTTTAAPSASRPNIPIPQISYIPATQGDPYYGQTHFHSNQSPTQSVYYEHGCFVDSNNSSNCPSFVESPYRESSDDISVDLRNAFREYRSLKRKK